MSRGSVGPYRLESQIGAGGMGVVYRAWDERLERWVAVKHRRRDKAEDSRGRQRFRREARAAARLNHPAVVQIFDVVEHADGDWIVMEYVEGRALARWTSEGPLEMERLLSVACEIARGLAEAHAKGVVHRDLKTQNILITPDYRAKILDFGLAKPIWRGQGETVTTQGALVGTCHAMSPEQVNGRQVDPRSDLFSLGSLLYEMATGGLAFRAPTQVETLKRVCTHQPPPADNLNQAVPKELAALIDRLLEKDPNHRPQSTVEVVDQLQAILESWSRGHVDAGKSPSLPVTEVSGMADLETEISAGADRPLVDPLPVVRTLLLTHLANAEELKRSLTDARASEVAARHDRLARDLLRRFEGLEVDKTDRFLLLFERPVDAVRHALAYHQGLAELGRELQIEFRARAGVHLAEVILRRNTTADVARGAKPWEVDGPARGVVARLMALATDHQTLMTRGAFDLARQASVGEASAGEASAGEEQPDLGWLAHGAYFFADAEEEVEVFEVGLVGVAPLRAPPGSEKALWAVSAGDRSTLGWRAAAGQKIPRRPHWVLREKVGQGGFGEVWLVGHQITGEKRIFKFCYEAERVRSLRREVILFRLLKETLGHRPDIARVLDWSFEEAPYFLEAEYTEGGDLVDWAQAHGGLGQLSMDTRLDFVAQVAEALAAAHSVGVLHKDVKPRNVLVSTDAEGRRQIRLTDFGIGLITDRSLLVERGITATGLTETASTDVGTELYRAPELTEGRAATIQADIYALGVLLYQVVVGDFGRALAPGWRRHVSDELLVEDLAFFVDGSPERRPGSALEVAERLRNLESRRAARRDQERARQEKNEARQALERSQRRRKLFAGLAAVATVVLVVVAIFAIRTDQAYRMVGRRSEQAEKLIGFMLGDLREKLMPRGHFDVLDDVTDKALEYFASLEAEDITEESLSLNAKALVQIGAIRVRSGDLAAAKAVFGQAQRLNAELVARDPDNVDRLLALLFSHSWIGSLHWHQGDFDAAEAEFRLALSLAQGVMVRQPRHDKGALRLAQTHTNIGKVLEARGSHEAARLQFQETLEVCQRQVARDPASLSWRRELAWAHTNMGKIEAFLGHLDSALVHYRTDLATKKELVDRDAKNKTWHSDLAGSHLLVAEVLGSLGEWKQALTYSQRAVAIMEKLIDQDSTVVDWRYFLATYSNAVGRALRFCGDRQGALNHFSRASSILEDLLAKAPTNITWQRELAVSQVEKGIVLFFGHQLEEALGHATRARERLEPLVTRDPRDRRSSLWLGRALVLLGKVWQAMEQDERANETRIRALALLGPFAELTSDLEVLAVQEVALRDAGNTAAANDLADKLRRSEYRKKDFLKTD